MCLLILFIHEIRHKGNQPINTSGEERAMSSDGASANEEKTTEIVISNEVTVIVRDEALEPSEYFEVIKSTSTVMDEVVFDSQLAYIATQLTNAKRIGQTNFVDWLNFVKSSLLRESMLLSLGIDQYVHRDALVKLIKYVQPKGSVKIIELSRYPRVVPDNVVERIQTIQSLDLFDDYIIVFTDLTNNDYKTKEEREFVERNTDPVIFGMFKDPKTAEQYDRLYLLADWEDETCNLTYTNMVKHFSTMKSINAKSPHGKLYPDTVTLSPDLSYRKARLSIRSFGRRFVGMLKVLWPWSKK